MPCQAIALNALLLENIQEEGKRGKHFEEVDGCRHRRFVLVSRNIITSDSSGWAGREREREGGMGFHLNFVEYTKSQLDRQQRAVSSIK